MTRIRPLLAALTAAALLPFGAAVALASPVTSTATSRPERVPLPSVARLVNAAGVSDGCHARAPHLAIVPQQGVNTIELPDAEGCPVSADIHWMSGAITLWQVMSDGTWRVVLPHSLSWIESATIAPITGGKGSGGAAFISCPDFGLSGPVTLVNRITIRARTALHDPTLYTAQVDREQTVTC
jgi:hypothetical protein